MGKSQEVILVLNGGADSNGELFEDTKLRITKGIDVARERNIPNIIMVGRKSKEMLDFALLQKDVQNLNFLVEDYSQNTIENAHYTKVKFLAPNTWHSIIIVTDKFHSNRARYTFENVLGNSFRIEMVESDANYSKNDTRALQEQEEFFAKLTREKLTNIQPHEDSKRQNMLDEQRQVSSDYFPLIRK